MTTYINGVAVPTGATKEFFEPVGEATEGYMSRPGHRVTVIGDGAYTAFFVPADFSAIISATSVRIARTTATHRLNYSADYGAQDEAGDVHSEALLDQDTAEIMGVIYEQDISGILSSLAANDHVGIRASWDDINDPNDTILGVRFKYS